jgi:hypothetical protein
LEIRVSTILKALQRLEDEKSEGVERSLDEQVVSHHLLPDPEPNRRGLKIGIAAIGSLAVAAAAFLLWPIGEDPDAVVATDSTPAAVAPVAAPAPAKQKVAANKPRRRTPARAQPAKRGQADLSEAKAAAIVEVVQRLDEQPADSGAPAASPNRAVLAAEPKRSARRPSARKTEPKTANNAAKSRPAAEQVADAKPVAIQKPEPAATAKSVEPAPQKPAPAPPEPIEIAAVAPKPAPVPESIPAPVREPEKKVVQRAKLPSLSIEKTIWHPDTDRRIAIVKLADAEEVLRLKEGDAIGPLVVESIKPGSVLFNHDGIEIRYNVGG